jgi:hypothetical protein
LENTIENFLKKKNLKLVKITLDEIIIYIYTFTHETHGDITCDKFNLIKKYDLDSSTMLKLIKGKRKSHKGWSLKNK